jgi:hypothetical protein
MASQPRSPQKPLSQTNSPFGRVLVVASSVWEISVMAATWAVESRWSHLGLLPIFCAVALIAGGIIAWGAADSALDLVALKRAELRRQEDWVAASGRTPS